MVVISESDLGLCRELAIPRGSLFEFTSRFLTANKLQPLLALYALQQAVSSIPRMPVDDAVKWAKLKWWSEELAAEPDAPSRHPVLRVLQQSGVREHLSADLLQGLVKDAVIEMDPAADNNIDAMFVRLAASGETGLLLEMALDDAAVDTENLRYLSAASGLYAYISNFSSDHWAEYQSLPLDVLAQFDVSRQSLQQQPASDELSKIIVFLANRADKWYQQGLSGLHVSGGPGACAHLQLRWAMENRRLLEIRKKAKHLLHPGKSYGPSDAWFAWRLSRRLGRS